MTEENVSGISSVPMIYGRSLIYPDELNLLISPLHCNVCNVKFNSLNISRLHYNSQRHLKNIENWIWKKAAIESCCMCSIRLQSSNDCKIHFNGKKHQRMLSRERFVNPEFRDPLEDWMTTYYNQVSQLPHMKRTHSSDDTQDDKVDGGATNCDDIPFKKAKTKSDNDKISIYRTPSGSYYCHTCNINIADENCFRNHLSSKRHSANLSAHFKK